MGKVFFFVAHDPGGYNLLAPIIEKLSHDGCIIYLCMLGPSKLKAERFRGEKGVVFLNTIGFPIDGFPNEYNIMQSDVSNMIAESLPDIIITGSSINSDIERYSIEAGKKINTPVVTIIDSWVGVDIRFRSSTIDTFPDIIIVNDIYMASLYEVYKSKGCQISILPNLNFEKLYNERKITFDKKDDKYKRVLFFSENLYHYKYADDINELIVIKNIINNCKLNCKINLVIRPHPLEAIDHWVSFIEENSFVNSNISIELDTISNLKESVFNSSMVIGISTMALIESSILNIPSFSYQIGFENRPDLLYIPFEYFGITRVTEVKYLEEIFSSGPKLRDTPALSFLDKESYSSYIDLFEKAIKNKYKL